MTQQLCLDSHRWLRMWCYRWFRDFFLFSLIPINPLPSDRSSPFVELLETLINDASDFTSVAEPFRPNRESQELNRLLLVSGGGGVMMMNDGDNCSPFLPLYIYHFNACSLHRSPTCLPALIVTNNMCRYVTSASLLSDKRQDVPINLENSLHLTGFDILNFSEAQQ